MTILNTLLPLLTLGVVSLLAWRMMKTSGDVDQAQLQRLEKEIEAKTTEIATLYAQMKEEQSQKDEIKGKNKQMFVEQTNLKAQLESATKDNATLEKRIAQHDADQKRKDTEHEKKLQELIEAKNSLQDERDRVRKEEEVRLEEELAERDRLWNEHEVTVCTLLSDLCSRPEYGFRTYDNKNLPEEFDGTLKPDFMVEFLGQYIIFDAKVSRSDNFQNYINTQVKNTVAKVKKYPSIYSTIFLVEPTEAIALLKKTTYYEGGYTVYIISPESIGPILASLKKITTYELADKFDPEEREGFINWIAKLDYHINVRNAFDIALAEKGSELLQNTRTQNPTIGREVEEINKKVRFARPSDTEIKKAISSLEAQDEKIQQLTAPKAAIEKVTKEHVAKNP